ncbi:MAG: acyltransferase [Candidatus Bathyarchaeia archaeon]|jgi:surface polysaccharide O-acyltransferase-like enzyme
MIGQDCGFSYRVDVIRAVAITLVILLHSQNDLTIQQMNAFEQIRWTTVDVYQSIGRIGVPLFLMLTGVLLLQPSQYNEPLKVFFKKRWDRIGLPVIFWGLVYFVWVFGVQQQPLTANAIVQGVLTGPYYQFWYIYLLIGLYLLTPLIRVLMAHASRNIIKYALILWFASASIMPLIHLVTPFYIDDNLLTFTGYAGYFILGAFLLTVKTTRRRLLWLLFGLGVALTAINTYAIAATVGGTKMFFFQQYLSPTLILSAASLFLLLITLQTPSAVTATVEDQKPSKTRKLITLISQNTLPLFLFHVIVLEAIQNGYLGLAINGNVINSVIGVPLMTVIVLFLSLGIILALKQIPGFKKLLG